MRNRVYPENRSRRSKRGHIPFLISIPGFQSLLHAATSPGSAVSSGGSPREDLRAPPLRHSREAEGVPGEDRCHFQARAARAVPAAQAFGVYGAVVGPDVDGADLLAFSAPGAGVGVPRQLEEAGPIEERKDRPEGAGGAAKGALDQDRGGDKQKQDPDLDPEEGADHGPDAPAHRHPRQAGAKGSNRAKPRSPVHMIAGGNEKDEEGQRGESQGGCPSRKTALPGPDLVQDVLQEPEERRVGKECRSRWS